MNTGKENAAMYFTALILPPQLNEKVLAYKKQLQEAYGCKVGLKSPAHITLIPPYWMPEAKEAALKDDMITLGQTLPAFTLTTANFSAFAPRTLFIAVQNSEPLQAVKKKNDHFFRHRDYKMKIESRPFHPHITLATRDLYKKDFAAAWTRFQNEVFEESFAVTGLSLLKHNGQSWDVVFTAPFTAAPAAVEGPP